MSIFQSQIQFLQLMKVPLLVLAGSEEGKLQLGLTAVRVRAGLWGFKHRYSMLSTFCSVRRMGLLVSCPDSDDAVQTQDCSRSTQTTWVMFSEFPCHSCPLFPEGNIMPLLFKSTNSHLNNQHLRTVRMRTKQHQKTHQETAGTRPFIRVP